MGLFQTFRQPDMASFIGAATNVVIYAAPGISLTVAEALKFDDLRKGDVVALWSDIYG
mgnify:CR=1 FL=1